MHRGKRNVSGLTLIELLAILAILAILAALLLPSTNGGGKARIPWCMSNQKQIDLGFQVFAGDNHGEFPMQLSVTNGGTMEFVQSGKVFPHIQNISKIYDGHYMGILICPTDLKRNAATNFQDLNDLNISYFLNSDVSTIKPSASVLTGDRNLEAVNWPVKSGLFALTTNIFMRWTDDLHSRRGCLSFADGHGELVSANLNSIIRNQPLSTNRLCVP